MRRNASWAFAGNSVYAGCQWVVFVLLVKSLGLAVEDVAAARVVHARALATGTGTWVELGGERGVGC